MQCKNCNKLNPKGSNFCQHCGLNLNQKDDSQKSDDVAIKQTQQESPISKQNTTLLDKFNKMYFSSGAERDKLLELTSNEAWELLQNFSTNIFENFIEENKADLNKHPYRLIESLKNNFLYSSTGGYWLWLAEIQNKNLILKPPKHNISDLLREDWKKLASDEYSKTYENISEEVKNVMNIFLQYRVDNFLESVPSAKDLTKELIDKLKLLLVYAIIWGYILGIAEDHYRK